MSTTVSQGPQLDANGLRQALRIAGGCTLGFAISNLMNWPYGIFFTVYPMLLLGLVPVISKPVIKQVGASAERRIDTEAPSAIARHASQPLDHPGKR